MSSFPSKIFLGSIFILLLSSSVFASTDMINDDYYRDKIVGTWLVPDSNLTHSETTYTKEGKVFYKVMYPYKLKATAVWEIKNGTLLVKVTSSSNEKLIPVGITTIDKIVDVTPERQILISNHKRVVRIKKNKPALLQ